MRLDNARIAITGGLGLIGSHLAHRLVDRGCSVLLIDSLNENFGGNRRNIEAIRDRVEVSVSDIRDTGSLERRLEGRDVIFNLAGQTSHQDSMNAPFEDIEINCLAQLSLLEVCRRINPSARIVFASTRQVYGRPQSLPVNESHPVVPVDVNGINKAAAENYHRLYHDVYGMRTTVLRLTNTYGPHMRIKDARQIFLGIWLRRLMEGQPFEVWGGEQKRDFTYAEDAADAFIAAAQSDETIGRVLNVGGSETVTLLELAQMTVTANAGGSFDVREFPLGRKKIDIGDYYTDDTAFRALTGWRSQVSVEAGLAETVKFYRANLAAYL